MNVVFWIIVVWVVLYIMSRTKGAPTPARRRRDHTCTIYIEDCSYTIDPETGQTLESVMEMHELIKKSRLQAELERAEARSINWGHDIDPRRLECRRCGEKIRSIYAAPENQRWCAEYTKEQIIDHSDNPQPQKPGILA